MPTAIYLISIPAEVNLRNRDSNSQSGQIPPGICDIPLNQDTTVEHLVMVLIISQTTVPSLPILSILCFPPQSYNFQNPVCNDPGH